VLLAAFAQDLDQANQAHLDNLRTEWETLLSNTAARNARKLAALNNNKVRDREKERRERAVTGLEEEMGLRTEAALSSWIAVNDCVGLTLHHSSILVLFCNEDCDGLMLHSRGTFICKTCFSNAAGCT
jgi:hypothetical protein